MSLEIVFTVAGENADVLKEAAASVDGAEVEYHSALDGGLEILGTIAIPTVTLAFTVISTLAQLRAKKDPTTKITNLHIYNGDQQIVLNDCDDASMQEALKKLK